MSFRGRGSLLAAAALATLVACSEKIRKEDAAAFALAAERAIAPFEASDETRRLLQRTSDAFWHLDASALHAALPDRGAPGEARDILFEAEHRGGTRFLRHEIPASPEHLFEGGIAPVRKVGREPGDGWLFAGALPLASSPGDYRLRITSALGSGEADSFSLWQSVPDVLEILESRGAKPGAGEPDPAVAEFQRKLPRTSAMILRYVDVLRSASWSAERRRSVVELRLRGEFPALTADYPGSAHYLLRLARSIRGSGAIQNEAGEPLITWKFQGPELGTSIVVGVDQGRLAPQTGGGPALDPLAPLHLRAVVAHSFALFGVTSIVEGIQGRVRTEPNGETHGVFAEISGEPTRVALEGRLFGFLPVSLIEALIPGNLEKSTRKILATVLQGRGGRGIETVMLLREDPPGNHQVSSSAVADIPAGRLARIGLRLFAAAIQPDDQEWRDLLRFVRDLLAALQEDLSGRKADHVSSGSSPG